MQNQTDSDSDEQTVQYLRESYSQIGLCSNVNQSSCLDSAFEFNFILPRIFLPTCQEELSVKASLFIGTAHFLAPFVLRFLFNRSTVENFRKTRFSLHYNDLCETSSYDSWSKLDDYYAKVNRIIKLDKGLNTIDDFEVYLSRVKTQIVGPLLKAIKDRDFSNNI